MATDTGSHIYFGLVTKRVGQDIFTGRRVTLERQDFASDTVMLDVEGGMARLSRDDVKALVEWFQRWML
jgi:hypothetical protein